MVNGFEAGWELLQASSGETRSKLRRHSLHCLLNLELNLDVKETNKKLHTDWGKQSHGGATGTDVIAGYLER